MEKIIMYRAEDGKMFDNEQDCLKYEERTTARVKKIWESMLTIMKICDGRMCDECPFYNLDEKVQTTCVLKQHNPCAWERNMINKEKL